jgi:hypothetical protein
MVCGAYWRCEHAGDGPEDPRSTFVPADGQTWKDTNGPAWLRADAAGLQFVSGLLSIDDLFTDVQTLFRAAFDAGAAAFDGLTAGLQSANRSLAKLAAELNEGAPDPKGNRAARRRKHAPPERPGWMVAFPPPDPARQQPRLAR